MVDQNRNAKWRKIWALRVPQRVRVFTWLAAHQAHLTNVERVRRHLAVSDECTLFHGGPEDFFSLPFDEWLIVNIIIDCRSGMEEYIGACDFQYTAGCYGNRDAVRS
ncbi:hypothetical protein V6N13_107179 [Hibiscus sabdariffa]